MDQGYVACSFDMLCVVDLDILRQARRLCSDLVVGVFTDDYVTALTGRPPIMSLAERLALVSAVEGVHEVRVHDDARGELDDRRFSVARAHGSDGEGSSIAIVPTVRTAGPCVPALAGLRSEGVA